MLIGIVLVIFAFNLAVPDLAAREHGDARARSASPWRRVMLSFLMMITRRKAVPQVIGFLAMENGLFFAATCATYGMPMVVELGIALDVLVGTLILGVFFFHIRETVRQPRHPAPGEAEGRRLSSAQEARGESRDRDPLSSSALPLSPAPLAAGACWRPSPRSRRA